MKIISTSTPAGVASISMAASAWPVSIGSSISRNAGSAATSCGMAMGHPSTFMM